MHMRTIYVLKYYSVQMQSFKQINELIYAKTTIMKPTKDSKYKIYINAVKTLRKKENYLLMHHD